MKLSRILIGFVILAAVISAIFVFSVKKNSTHAQDFDDGDMDDQDSITALTDTVAGSEQRAEVVEVKKYQAGVGELGLFDLRGPVKKCVMRDAFGNKRTYTFDEKGFWKTEDGQSLKKKFPDHISRDRDGRITEGAPEEYYAFNYEWNTKGLVTSSWSTGEFSITYKYDDDGNLTKRILHLEPDMGDESGGETITSTFTAIEKDKYGNWTKRKDQKGKVEERTIEYYAED